MNDSVETVGARNRHEATSHLVVQMTLPIRILRHGSHPPLFSLPLNFATPSNRDFLFPTAAPRSKEETCLDHMEPSTIFPAGVGSSTNLSRFERPSLNLEESNATWENCYCLTKYSIPTKFLSI